MSLNGDPRYQSGYGNGYETNPRGGYGQNAGRYGMMGSGRGVADGKVNGFHGVKQKRGDMDRECKSMNASVSLRLTKSA